MPDEQPPPAILIADDNDDLRAMLAAFLKGRGYDVLTAGGGGEAVDAALGSSPSLVLMDVGMPGVDGLSAAREIRRTLSAAELPILVVSAYDTAELRAEALEAGCNGYVTKPVDPAALLRTVNLLLGRACE
ncbi:MAG: response regulator [Acidobacteriota bacterium]|nr:response regulator [Acidobacteriota bacterium]